jgi:hypothetical protein
MKIKCQEHYEETVKYAESIGDKTLEQCMERLKLWEKNSKGRYEIELYKDFAPYSFGFAERTTNGRTGIVGGLLYHGRPDNSFAVLLEPFHGWSIHT